MKDGARGFQGRMSFDPKQLRLRRKLRAAEAKLRITAPMVPLDHRVRQGEKAIVPLGESEFEEQMRVGFLRKR